jgi:hypothetical protein
MTDQSRLWRGLISHLYFIGTFEYFVYICGMVAKPFTI